jgi:hypothetical protein
MVIVFFLLSKGLRFAPGAPATSLRIARPTRVTRKKTGATQTEASRIAS